MHHSLERNRQQRERERACWELIIHYTCANMCAFITVIDSFFYSCTILRQHGPMIVVDQCICATWVSVFTSVPGCEVTRGHCLCSLFCTFHLSLRCCGRSIAPERFSESHHCYCRHHLYPHISSPSSTLITIGGKNVSWRERCLLETLTFAICVLGLHG